MEIPVSCGGPPATQGSSLTCLYHQSSTWAKPRGSGLRLASPRPDIPLDHAPRGDRAPCSFQERYRCTRPMRAPGQAPWRNGDRPRLVKARPPIVQDALVPTKRHVSRRRLNSFSTMSYRRYPRRATPRNSAQLAATDPERRANGPQTRRTARNAAALRAKTGAIEPTRPRNTRPACPSSSPTPNAPVRPRSPAGAVTGPRLYRSCLTTSTVACLPVS